MTSSPPRAARQAPYYNRLGAVMTHIYPYCFRGISRLARDCGIAKSTLSRLARGRTDPKYSTVREIVKCFESHLARRLDPSELLSEDGSYPTPYVCELVGCPGCLPDAAYDDFGNHKAQFSHVQAGRWSGDVAEFVIKEDQ